MPMSLKVKEDLILLGKMFIFAVVVLFLVSADSYTRDLYGRNNSAWFFMCGKAWMNGMVPYVDFTDSKGPLLWLIYGVGYLVSHYDYTGVYWVSCVFYAFTFFFVYKTAHLFLRSGKWSWLVVIIMTIFFFNAIYHRETKTEDFAQPFMMGAVYFTSKLLYVCVDRRNVVEASLWLGVAFGCTFMMKYNIAAILCIFIVYTLWAVHAEPVKNGCPRIECGGWGAVARSLALMLAGVAVVWLPLLVYFIVEGNLKAFSVEYFYNTMHTVNNLENRGTLVDQLGSRLVTDAFPLTVQLFATLSPVVVTYMKRCRTFPLVAFAVGAVVNSMNGLLIYYFNSTNGLVVFGVISLALLVRNYRHAKSRRINWWAALVVFPLLVINNNDVRGNYFLHQNSSREAFYYYAALATQYEKPTVIFYRGMPNPDFTVTAGALPGCKYWAQQNGATSAMRQEQDEAVRSRKADLVAVYASNYAARDSVKKAGYYAYKSPAKANRYVLFSKKELVEPPEGWGPSVMQVLLKKRMKLTPADKAEAVRQKARKEREAREAELRAAQELAEKQGAEQ